MILLSPSDFDAATLTSPGGAADFDPLWPITNLQEPLRQHYAQALKSDVTIHVDFGQQVIVGALGLVDTDLTETDSIKVSGHATPTAIDDWSESFAAVPLITTFGSAPLGTFPLGMNAPADLRQLTTGVWLYEFSQQYYARYIQVRIAAADVFAIGRMILGRLVQGPDVDYGFARSHSEETQVQKSHLGVRYANVKPKAEALRFTVRGDNATAFGEWQRFLADVGIVKDFVFLGAQKTTDPIVRAQMTFYGHLTEYEVAMPGWNNNALSASFEEAVHWR